jgi:hypothetical protein
MERSFVGFRQPLFVNKETIIVRTTAPSSDNLPSTLFLRYKPQQASTKEQYNRAEELNHQRLQVGTRFELISIYYLCSLII